MTAAILIYRVIVAFGSFLEWAAKGRFQAFVFFSVVGSFLALVLIGVGVAFTLGTFEMLFDARFTFTAEDWWPITLLALSAVSGMAWAAHVCHREFKPSKRTRS